MPNKTRPAAASAHGRGKRDSSPRAPSPPPPATPRQRRRAARTSEILSLAMRQIEHQGIDGMTLQEIAEELDYTVAALYRYFPSKDAIIAELQRRVVAVLDRKLGEVQVRSEERVAELDARARKRFGPLVPIAAAGLFYAGLARSAPDAFGLLAISLGDPRRLIDDAHARVVLDTARPMLERIAAHSQQASDAGLLAAGDHLDRAITIWGAMHGVIQLGKLSRLAPALLEPEPLCHGLMQALLTGWGAKGRSAAEAIDLVLVSGTADVTISPDDLARVAPHADD